MILYGEFKTPCLLVVCNLYLFSFQGFSSFKYERR
jgi:hypothetical protein